MRFCYSRLQTRVAGLSHDIEQLSRSVNSEDSTTQIRGCSDPFSFSVHFMKPSSRCTLVRILPTSSSKSAMRHCGCQFFLTSWSMSANRAFGTVRSPFCRQSSHIEARNRGNAETETLRRRPQKPHYPKKTRVFRAQKRFTGELTHFQHCYSSLLLPHVSCSCSPCFCHDDRTIGLPPDIRHESLGSFRTKLPLKM